MNFPGFISSLTGLFILIHNCATTNIPTLTGFKIEEKHKKIKTKSRFGIIYEGHWVQVKKNFRVKSNPVRDYIWVEKKPALKVIPLGFIVGRKRIVIKTKSLWVLYIQGIFDVGKKNFRFKNNPVRDYMWVEKYSRVKSNPIRIYSR